MLIWYAAYGSNLLRERFLVYLRGGAVPGSGRPQHGARDRSDPVDSAPYRLDRPMGFGRESRGWAGGGVSFVDSHRVEAGAALGRGWLITAEQLADVWAQENGQTVGPAVDVDALASAGQLDLGRGWYRRLAYLGTFGDHPVATITCDEMPPPNPAGSAYLEVVGRGLMETWSIGPVEAADYLTTCHDDPEQVDHRSLIGALTAAAALERP